MTSLKTAAQQALDTLLKSHTCPLMPDDCEAAIAALCVALTETVPNDCPDSHQPVAWIHTDSSDPRMKFLEWRENESGYSERWIKTPLYTAPHKIE